MERLFGLSRTTIDTDPGGSVTYTSFSLFSKVAGDVGYSAPRLGFDYLAASGASFGVAFGFQSVSVDDDNANAWLFAPRLGYFVRPSDSFGIWPRVGLTHIVLDFEDSDSDTATALTLEVPLEFMLAPRVALVLTPLAEIGIAGSVNGEDRTVSEIGLQFGLGAFF